MENKAVTYPGNSSRKFIYRTPFAALFILIVILCFSAFFTTAEVVASDYSGGFAFFLFATIFFLFLGAHWIAGWSDIIIDERGISRSILGMSWRVIKWEDIRFILIRESFDPNARKKFKFYEINSISKPKSEILSGAKMTISERMEQPREFIELINKYISKYNIKVESTVNGEKFFLTNL